ARLCNALVANELLKKKNNKYSNTSQSKRFLLKDSPHYQGNILEHHWHLLKNWINLDLVLKNNFRYPRNPPKRSKREIAAFILGMKNRTIEGARDFLKHINLSWARNMLDLGGGPAAYSITFAKKYKNLKATVLDLPEVIPITKNEIKMANATSVTAKVGNILAGNYGQNFDLVFISNIIHSFDLATNLKIFQHSLLAMAPKGKIMVKDFYVNESRSGPYFPVMFSINMLMGTPDGDTYTVGEIKKLLQQVGFVKIKVVDVGQDSQVIMGEKPGQSP
ncbi:MAG: methyltransferase, partial [Pseudomonadota bacterium]